MKNQYLKMEYGSRKHEEIHFLGTVGCIVACLSGLRSPRPSRRHTNNPCSCPKLRILAIDAGFISVRSLALPQSSRVVDLTVFGLREMASTVCARRGVWLDVLRARVLAERLHGKRGVHGAGRCFADNREVVMTFARM